MKTLRLIKEEVKKMYSNVAFPIVIFATMVIYLSGTIYINPMTKKEYNLFTVITLPDYRSELLARGISFQSIFLSGTDSYIWMFAPILASIPFVALLCGAKKNNNIRFEIMRVGKKGYIFGKMISAMLAGGTAFMLGYLGFGLVIYVMLPQANAYALDNITYIYTVIPKLKVLYDAGGLGLVLVLRIVAVFIYGMTTVVLPFAASSLIKNKYLVICIPFMLNYFLDVFLRKQTGIIPKVAEIIAPTQPVELFRYNFEKAHWIALYWLVCVVLTMILHYVVLNRRCDCGE